MTRRPHMTWASWARLATAVALGLAFGSSYLQADPWNDRTTLRFSSSVMVPGATLEPGEYVFRIMDFKANRHMVQIRSADDSRVIAITHAVPVKRQDPKGTTTLTFAATEGDAPVALKAWYYPGTVYGHEFIYSDEEAREIASRHKTIVLAEGEDGVESTGSLRMYGADGTPAEWRQDESVEREWKDWTSRKQR